MEIKNIDIKKFRKKFNLSQSELAELLGVHLRTIQNYEIGGAVPKSKNTLLRKIVNDYENKSTHTINQKAGTAGINIAGAAGSEIGINQGNDAIKVSQLEEENLELKGKVKRLEKQIDKLFKMLDDK